MSYYQDVENYRLQLQERLEINPQDVDAMIRLGALEFEFFHELESALSLLEKAVQIDPLYVNAKFWFAMCLFYDNFEYDRAEKLLKEALNIDPKRADCLCVIARIICDNNGPPNESIEYVKKAISLEPDWPALRCQLAELFLTIGNIEAAEQEIEKILKISPLDPKKITNEVDRYYETVVTGRSWNDEKKASLYIIKRLQEAKKDRSKNTNYS